jgi:hypothetical protein
MLAVRREANGAAETFWMGLRDGEVGRQAAGI